MTTMATHHNKVLTKARELLKANSLNCWRQFIKTSHSSCIHTYICHRVFKAIEIRSAWASISIRQIGFDGNRLSYSQFSNLDCAGCRFGADFIMICLNHVGDVGGPVSHDVGAALMAQAVVNNP